jgi:hypothetical protein
VSATIDKGDWHRDASCDECHGAFVYRAPDVTLDVRYLELIATCPECGARVRVEAPVRRRRELIAAHFTAHAAPVNAAPNPLPSRALVEAIKPTSTAKPKGGRK